MTDDLDPLEAELRAFRPHEPSPNLRRRIGEQLAAAPAREGVPGRATLAVLVAAAVAGFAVLMYWGDRQSLIVCIFPPLPATEWTPPTVQAYHQGLAKSPEALDALLDEQARHSAAASAQARPVRAFSIAPNRDFLDAER